MLVIGKRIALGKAGSIMSAAAPSQLIDTSNLPVSLTEDGAIRIELPGWSFSSFTRTGKLALHSVLRLNSVFAYMDLSDLFSGIYARDGNIDKRIGIIASSRATCSRELYVARLMQPTVLLARVAHIGTTSVTIVMELIDRVTGTVLVQDVRRVVYINLENRKPTNIPEKLKANHIKNRVVERFKYEPAEMPPDSADIFMYSVRVTGSDSDQYNHTNAQSYTRFIMDATYKFASAGLLKSVQYDIAEYDVHRLSYKYASESYPGDQLQVKLWQDRKNAYSLHARVYKDDTVLVYCSIDIYPNSVSKM